MEDLPDNLRSEWQYKRWLEFYLDHANKETFGNGTESARQAGFEVKHPASAGSACKKRYAKFIKNWVEEEGLGDVSLKLKLIDLINAKETKFFTHKGYLVDWMDVEALGIQQKALDMAFKLRGDYAPEKKEIYDRSHDAWMDELDKEDEVDPFAD